MSQFNRGIVLVDPEVRHIGVEAGSVLLPVLLLLVLFILILISHFGVLVFLNVILVVVQVTILPLHFSSTNGERHKNQFLHLINTSDEGLQRMEQQRGKYIVFINDIVEILIVIRRIQWTRDESFRKPYTILYHVCDLQKDPRALSHSYVF